MRPSSKVGHGRTNRNGSAGPVIKYSYKKKTDPNSIAARSIPVIIRFRCREDRDDVFRAKGKLKESGNEVYKASISQQTSIRNERAMLVRAMLKAQAAGKSAKVINTTLLVYGRKNGVSNVPEELKES